MGKMKEWFKMQIAEVRNLMPLLLSLVGLTTSAFKKFVAFGAKMAKREIPELWEDVSEIKYIGPYLTAALNGVGIHTCEDLVDALEEFGQPWEYEVTVRNRVRDWLQELLQNARAGECCYSESRVIDGEECAYLARDTNEKGYNAILKVMRHYAMNPYRKWVPHRFRGRQSDRTKYPRKCNMDFVF
jgi:hypothetical protein